MPSLIDRLYRRPRDRIARRLRCCRERRRMSCGRLPVCEQDSVMDEKCRARRPVSWLSVFSMTNRVWQFVAALGLYGIYVVLLCNEKAEGAAETTRREAILGLAPVMMLYQSSVLLVSCLLRKPKSRETKGWRFVSIVMIVGDLLMMRLSLSKMNVLSSAGALGECDPAEQNFVKSMLKNGAAMAYHRLGWPTGEQEDVDILCCLPKIVYLLCGIAIFSYTFSILFTGLQLQKHWPGNSQAYQSGHVEEAIPDRNQQVQLVFVPQPSFATPRPSSTAPRPSEPVEPATEPIAPVQTFRATRQSMSTTRSASEDLPRYTNEVDTPYPEMPVRSSMETTSSFNPDLYLISDGFRPAPELPTYSSRPPSFRGRPPSYASRPSSIRNV